MVLGKSELLAGGGLAWKGEVDGVGEVCIRQITGEDFDFIQANATSDTPDRRGLMARIVTVGLCDEDGKPIFTYKDLATVNKIPFMRLKELANAVQEHAGIGDDDVDDAAGN